MALPEAINILNTTQELESVNGTANAGTLAKKITRLEKHARHFIAQSPFAVLCTQGEQGCDASPRGDPPGFAKCLDDTTLLMPERPGNRLADSMRNLLSDPHMALIFMIPGINETLRVNGRGYITDHEPYLAQLAHKGRPPKLAILVDVTEIYFHCPKAFIRSDLWGDTFRISRDTFPTLGRMLLEQINGTPPDEVTGSAIDQALERDSIENLY